MADGAKPVAVSDLWLGVYLRPIHPEFFDIRARRVYRRPGYEAEFWLFGPGHLFTIVVGRDCITEILVPVGTELPKRGLLKRWQIHRERDERVELRGQFLYQMSFQVEQMPMAEYLRQQEEFRTSAAKYGVFRVLADTDRSTDEQMQFAYGLPEPRANAFLLQTFHGFPAERTILKTQTVVDIT